MCYRLLPVPRKHHRWESKQSFHSFLLNFHCKVPVTCCDIKSDLRIQRNVSYRLAQVPQNPESWQKLKLEFDTDDLITFLFHNAVITKQVVVNFLTTLKNVSHNPFWACNKKAVTNSCLNLPAARNACRQRLLILVLLRNHVEIMYIFILPIIKMPCNICTYF